jgi:hypothetical protein
MARIRTIKPDFFTSLTIAELDWDERLTFIGLWTHCDDEGRCVADGRLLKAALWPLDDEVGPDQVEGHLESLQRHGLVQVYEVDGRRYLQVTRWDEHQRINRPTASKLPPPGDVTEPPDDPPATAEEPSPPAHARLTEPSPPEGNGTGKGTGTSRAADATRKPRPPDLLFEAVCDACGIDRQTLTPSGRGPLNRAVKEIREVAGTPEDVPRRAAEFRRRFPEASLTPSALAKHWGSLASAPRPRSGSGPPVVGSPEWEARERAERERAEQLVGER